MEWQPIDSAPKDGRRILLFVPSLDEPLTVGDYHKALERGDDGRFKRGGWARWLAMDSDYLSSYCEPSHWMPLPAPPGASPRP